MGFMFLSRVQKCHRRADTTQSPRAAMESSSPGLGIRMSNASPMETPGDAANRRAGKPSHLAFNFESISASPPTQRGAGSLSPVVKSRRGHHHKHSLSHQIFLPPPQRAPLSLPASFHVPTWREVASSCTSDQQLAFLWSLIHLSISAAVVKFNAASLAVAAIAKLVAFDALGVFCSALFEVLDNFPVWQKSSIQHPFGLKRAQVVVNFGQAVYLTYAGFELIREIMEHAVLGGGHGHGSSDSVHMDPHSLSSSGNMPLSMAVVCVATLFSRIVYGNHGHLVQIIDLDGAPQLLQNPFAILTLLPAAMLLGLSALGMHLHAMLDRALTAFIAAIITYIGSLLIFRLGSILLMTYPSTQLDAFYHAIQQDDEGIVELLDGKTWQVWSNLVVVGIRVVVRGGETGEIRARERIARLARNVLGGGYGSGKQIRFSVHVECERSSI
ncbi:cation efflux family-domain-containing protein [Protomyces lactucae-debilis]|uniref:Cation efflux family-domain-containing protein n=1 Tax=Protomyces lactucae-debilis TaxID=2754530 RepID=A0A1Y2FQH9_PROLT|nr:cation efflux family-domain-containing protein [Protomyces lactucae-debilis]ORY86253.1 cation efflux family-domain-containing protein [Protomyces lactucae-debilis]